MKAEEVSVKSQNTINKDLIKSIADSLAEELAKKMYYKLTLLKYLPEVKAIERGKAKSLKGKEVYDFLKNLKNSK